MSEITNIIKTKGRDKTLAAISRRAIQEITKAWRNIASITITAMTGRVRADVPKEDERYLIKQISDCIFAKGGEISNKSRTVNLGMTYLHLTEEGRKIFLRILAKDFDVNISVLEDKIKIMQSAKNNVDKTNAELQLREALVPPRVKLLKQFNTLPNGFQFLINMRADLLPLAKENPFFKKLDTDLKNLLISWFDVSLLDLEEITWDSPAALLERLIEYEAVHEIQSWSDMKRRLRSDRRCFAFFHYKVPNEPLIFIEVALVNGMSDNIQKLLDESAASVNPENADTAIFYSISNTQKGLAGINLGNFLIEHVIEKLSGEFKKIKHFATLSPIPGFGRWLDQYFSKEDNIILAPKESEIIRKITGSDNLKEGLHKILDSKWYTDCEISEALKVLLMKLCAHYLLKEKRGENAYNLVANFHLTNGARIERINWLADISKKGIEQSLGLMVNYYYELSKIAENHENYNTEGKVAATRDVKSLLKNEIKTLN